MQFCVVCEKVVIEHNLLKSVYYCANTRCTRLGVLSVFVLTPAKPVPVEEVKNEDIPQS